MINRSKYRNKKVEVDGIQFDSAREAKRWKELSALQNSGEIKNLRRQVPFIIIPAQKDPESGKTLERDCRYIADFVYDNDKGTVVEDTKGFRTPEYVVKRKLMLREFGIRIKEI